MNNQPTNYPSDKVLDYKDFITERLNYWKDLLVQRTEAYYEAMNRREKNPTATIMTTSGQAMSITKICSLRVAPLLEAISTVETLEKMLKQAHSDDLMQLWNRDTIIDPEASIPSPMTFQGKGADEEQSDGESEKAQAEDAPETETPAEESEQK